MNMEEYEKCHIMHYTNYSDVMLIWIQEMYLVYNSNFKAVVLFPPSFMSNVQSMSNWCYTISVYSMPIQTIKYVHTDNIGNANNITQCATFSYIPFA